MLRNLLPRSRGVKFAGIFKSQMTRASASSKVESTTSEPFHLPLSEGCELTSRYQVLRKLGSGQHSTVWLARKLFAPCEEVAIKVLTNEVTAFQGGHAYELEVLKRIQAAQSSQVAHGQNYLLQLVDHFTATGEHGAHLCLVTPRLGRSLLDVQRSVENRRLPIALVKVLSRQLLRGLVILHDDCHTVHTDIKPDNILFEPSEDLEDTLVDPEVFTSKRIVLVDFGTAMPAEGNHDRLIQPEALRCPEVLLGCRWDTKADIWNLGCIIFELLAGTRLFRPRPGPNYDAEQIHLARMFSTFCKEDEPEDQRLMEFCRTGRRFDKFFSETRMKVRVTQKEPIKTILGIYKIYTPELEEFLEAMLRIHPDDRLSAKQLLNLPWLQS